MGESVVFTGAAVSDVSTLTMSSNLAIGGNINRASGNLAITAGGTTTVESVVFNGGAMSSVTDLDMSGDLNCGEDIILDAGSGTRTIQRSAGNLQITATSGTVTVESVVFTGAAVSVVSTLT